MLGAARHALTLVFDALAANLTSPPDRSVGDSDFLQHWEATIADDTHICTVSAQASPHHAQTAAGFPLERIAHDAVRTRRLPTTVLVPFGDQCVEVQLRRIARGVHATCRVVDPHGPLTRRELQVLAELVQGRSNREIAEVLTITPRTVATHVEHILAKLDVPNRVAAAAYGARLGLDLGAQLGA